jgi:hypothetical protein
MKIKFGVAGHGVLSEIIPVVPDPGNAGGGRIEIIYKNPFSPWQKGFCVWGYIKTTGRYENEDHSSGNLSVG